MYNFKIIKQVLICLVELILDMSGKFKVMHFISNNLLYDFPNGKYIFPFFIKNFMLKNKIQPNLTQTQPDLLVFHVYIIGRMNLKCWLDVLNSELHRNHEALKIT